MKSLEKLFEKGRFFVENIKPNKKILLVFHQDVDGICSGVIAYYALRKIGFSLDFISSSIEKLERILLNTKHKQIIILDLPVKNLPKKLCILVIDHHPLVKLKNIVCINPCLVNKKIYQPTSYIAYKFFSGLIDIKEKEWVAVLGTVGDYGFEYCKDLLLKWIKIKKKENIWKTRFGKAAIIIFSAAIELGFENVFNILLKSKSLKDLLKNKKIINAYKNFTRYYKKKKKEFWKNAESFNNLIISVITEEEKRVGSMIASELARKYPEKIIFLLGKTNEKYKIHARSEKDTIHLGKILKKVCGGGGHQKAAGGIIKQNMLEVFKKKVLRELGYKIS